MDGHTFIQDARDLHAQEDPNADTVFPITERIEHYAERGKRIISLREDDINTFADIGCLIAGAVGDRDETGLINTMHKINGKVLHSLVFSLIALGIGIAVEDELFSTADVVAEFMKAQEDDNPKK